VIYLNQIAQGYWNLSGLISVYLRIFSPFVVSYRY